ncbi:histidine kinase [Streptomyces sp. NPDC026092]|uniref:sensor histidine kinase n=1 Tax=Streptomyces sp. NPDC026092 TaxID=3154797 RepID=UPI00340443D0
MVRKRIAIGLLAVLLPGLVVVEYLWVDNESAAERTTGLVTGLLVCLCALPVRRVRLEVRAATAALVSLGATVGLLLAGLPLRNWGVGESIALLFLLWPVLRRSEVRTAVRLGPLLAVAAVAVPPRDLHALNLLEMAATAGVAANALSLRVHDGRRATDLAAVRAHERRDLARELHDLVAHHVAGIVVMAQAGHWTAGASEADARAAEAFTRIAAEGDEALAAMHRLVGMLREGTQLEPVAGMEQVRGLVESFSRSGPRAVLEVEPGVGERLDELLAVTVHRIVRESLTNVRKHAVGATEVRVSVRVEGTSGVRVTVRDDGRSAPHADNRRHRGGFGVVGMTERAEVLGGRLTAGPMPEGGWQVDALFPGGETWRS